MTFVIGKIVNMLTMPGTVLLLCCVLGVLLTAHRRSRLGRGLLLIGVWGFVVVLLLPVGQWALLPLEDRFPAVTDPPAHVDGIVVLGGVMNGDLTAERGMPSLNDAAERITTAVALARRYPTARLVFTSGQGALFPGEVPEADAAGDLLLTLGVPPAQLTLERQSRTTFENAVMTKALVAPQPGQTWILVTSAWHMPRSVGIFRQVGWPVLPWPVGYKTSHRLHLWLPTSLADHLGQLDTATHEWIGLVAYRLLGRTDALFPGPEE